MKRAPRRRVARRDHGYKAVHRPTRWGNPFSVERHGRREALRLYERWLDARLRRDPAFLEPLRGHDLGCFCALEQPCHADILLRRLAQTAPRVTRRRASPSRSGRRG